MPIRLYPYKVQPGDTVTAISRRTGVPRAAIVGANQMRYGVSYVAGLGCCFQDQPTEGDTLYVPSLTKELRDRIVSMSEDATIHDFRHRFSTLRYDESRQSQLGTVGMPNVDAMKAAKDVYTSKFLQDSQFPSDVPAMVNAMASFWQYNPTTGADPAAPGAMDAPLATAQKWIAKAGGHATPDMTVIPWPQVDWSAVPWEIFAKQPVTQTAAFWQNLASQYASAMPSVSTGTVDLVSGYDWFQSDFDNAAMPGTAFVDRPWKDVPWTIVPWSAIPWREIPWSAIDWSKITPDGAAIVDQIKGWYTNGTTKCTANGQVLAADGSCVKPGDPCGVDSAINAQGDCQCKDGFTWAKPEAQPGDMGFHDCMPKTDAPTSECRPPCGRGKRCVGGKCMPANLFGGGNGQTLPPPPCPDGQHQASDGSCVKNTDEPPTCSQGEVLVNGKCVPEKKNTGTTTGDTSGAPAKKDNKAIWIAGGIGVVALAGYMILAAKKRKQEG